VNVDITPAVSTGPGKRLLLIAGPCQIESLEHCLHIARYVQQACASLPISFVFKASFDKANRTSAHSARGVGMEEGLAILQQVRSTLGVPVLTDVHNEEQAARVGTVVDVLQIPAFLCRQTDLLLAAGRTGKTVHVKKGQFLHPSDMRFVAEKIASTGNNKILLCERGTSFGYRDLVMDPRSLLMMRETGYPVVFDATHSVQQLGGTGGSSGGSRQFVAALARAAVAVGVDGVFIECHNDPDNAPSDGPCMLPLETVGPLLKVLCDIRRVAHPDVLG
jgi:2-dehydro-3-deoxyphosphooctonate aldolase (KDO 8-P synthase)